MHEYVIEAEQVTLSPEQRSSIDPIVFEDLPPSGQEIASIAIEGVYRKCLGDDLDTRDSIYSFADRAVEHADEDLTAYLKRGDDYYKLYVQILDQVYVS